jgi:DNA polymerase-1
MATSEQKVLFLFDASSHFSRVFKKAIDSGALSRGESFHNGNPIFALPSTVGNIINQIKAVCGILQSGYTNIAIVLDHEGRNFRHEMYPEYKANRPPKTAEFIFQRSILPKYIEMSGFPVLKVNGVESDDVIGTLVRKSQLRQNPPKIIIFTKDKDLLQLVGENVMIYNGDELIDCNGVVAKTGVNPHQIVDLLTLMGDVADNIKGVKGCGKKTAIEILASYTLEQILDKPELVESTGVRTRKAVIKYLSLNSKSVKETRKLVELKCDINLGVTMNDLVYKERANFTMKQFMESQPNSQML